MSRPAWILLVLVVVSGCTQEQEISQTIGLGNLCSGEENCIDFCLTNNGQCAEFCNTNENPLCQKIFQTAEPIEDSVVTPDEPNLETIGVDLDFYNPLTKKAGVFTFNKFTYSWNTTVYNTKVFYDYGEADVRAEGTVRSSQPIFIVPLGTKVLALTSGVVSDIHPLYSGDYTVMVVKPENPKWVYEHEHVINPTVNIGDTVVGGQEIAEVSNYSQWLRNDGYGVLDIGILTAGPAGSPLHHCPFMYLNASVKQVYFEKITALYKAWEEYKGDTTLYSEETHAIPGCIILESFP